ncbi:FabD/lysophospholipase-like protein [Rhizodiscina lignyota]|uniref:FabD/lysophospholipase-like protein n=1 Tax=Rhizodiscina lignyota TaxID=1504668 RepID=A0A9P4IAL4_9PEZI|nr:FabD/lysophospholipase-like protein [Rhizodiscina lignyota]
MDESLLDAFEAGCWKTQVLHRPGKQPKGIPHEQALPEVVDRLKATFNPPSDEVTQERLHLEDEETTWFGIARDSANHPIFQDYGRYATLFANSAFEENAVRFPRLVSFIGQTGAGKSTLVKMLIERKTNGFDERHLFPTPVVGTMKNDIVPTSGDVHLYADPPTYFGQFPLLYADCEGLDGGETLPIGAQSRNSGGDSRAHDSGRLKKRLRLSRNVQRDITWADSPEKQKREYGVTELYPRLLYTFSDVVVFVLQNPKVFQSSVLSKLIEWADAVVEKSTNQPVLPHAIIALNASDPRIDASQWDVDVSTQDLMDRVSSSIWQDEKYRKYVEYWSSHGKPVHSMSDLIGCYYSSIRVVRIPRDRYMLVEQQVSKPYEEINIACAKSYDTKRKSRMLANSDELHQYLQAGFDHFAQNLDMPFNFMEVAFRNSPIPRDFGGNILKLAVAILSVSTGPPVSTIFESLSVMVASCIVLDLVRHGLKGRNYVSFCDDALKDFCRRFWPCEFSNRLGHCINVLEGHKKGHQNEKGKIISGGDYISTFSFEQYRPIWRRSIMLNVIKFQKMTVEDMGLNPTVSEKDSVSERHRSNVQEFYRRYQSSRRFCSHTACFCCLRGLPEHPLDCGHVLCTPCARTYSELDEKKLDEQERSSESKDKNSIILHRCPLHSHTLEGYGLWFTEPWEIKLKPDLSGIRILSLDGGGVRGIVELEVLRALELYLGGRIPIQSFFDLIVGTSTGGILAMGLGVENWPVETCIRHFTRLCDKAFTLRLPGMRLGRKYRTRPFEECLKEVLPDEYMFGGEHDDPRSYHRRVAITSTTDTGQSPVIFTNYNREVERQVSYKLIRPDNPRNELKRWEVLRAASAAPGYFKPFVKKETQEGYLDGALYHNNPVRVAYHESKLLWLDVAEYQPDILLSIGTGHNGEETTGTAEPYERRWRRAEIISDIIVTPSPRERKFRLAEWIKGTELGQSLSVMINRVDNILNSDQAWEDFKKDVLPSKNSPDSRRYQRINPKLGFRPPNLDDKRQLDLLQATVRVKLQEEERYLKKISRVAHQLVASSFYFERLSVHKEDDGYHCWGKACFVPPAEQC